MLTVILAVLLVLALAFSGYLLFSAIRLGRFIRRLDTDRSVAPPAGGPAFLSEASVLAANLARRLDSSLAAVAAERDRLKATIDASSSGIVALSADGTIALLNEAARELLKPNQLAEGMPLARAIRDHEIIAAIERSRSDRQPATATVEYGPRRRPIQVTVDPLPASRGWSALLVLNDLSEVRRVEKTRREFVSNVSHELRTPLASVRAAVETLEDGALEDASAARSFLTSIRAEVDRMTRMVEELLELSTMESGAMRIELQPTDLGPVVQAAADRILGDAQGKQLTIETSVAPDLPRVLADNLRLEQAIFNLLQNAVTFTAAGGNIRIEATADPDSLSVRVVDSGAGIARKDLPHVFERFYKVDRARSSQGIGLGLAIVKHTVQAHGGSVFVDSEPEQGSTFGFTLPLAAEG